VGAAIGLGVAAFGAQAVGSQLYQVSPLDPLTFTGVVALILICASVAALLPALRATRIDPATALRYE
jgi:ABC-type antimicrobial peptide transport system permease subunit